MDYTAITHTSKTHTSGTNANNNYINKWKEFKEINSGYSKLRTRCQFSRPTTTTSQIQTNCNSKSTKTTTKATSKLLREKERERASGREKGIAAVCQLRTMVQVQRECSARRRQQQGDECKDAHSPLPTHHTLAHLTLSPAAPSVVSSYCIDKYSKRALEGPQC